MPTPKKKSRRRNTPKRSGRRLTQFDDSGTLHSSISLLPQGMLARLGITREDIVAVGEFQQMNDEDRLTASRDMIIDSVINATNPPDQRCFLAVTESESLLKGYATLDKPHRSEIARVIHEITAYLRDDSRRRPFNALMLAAPGAGKSHFIKQLAAAMKDDNVQAVTFNMATMQSPDDMAQPVDELRNLKVNDRFPLLFLDEFDSDPSRYASLLPLLWEGELHVGHRDLKLGKAVIVLAGSNPDLPKVMYQSAQMRLDSDTAGELVPTGKLVDLLSRINGGVINIPDFDLRTVDRDRRVDKVCVTVSLLKARFGENITLIPRSLLRFIAHTTFRYGVRSIAHLIDIIGSAAFKDGVLSGSALGLPITSEAGLQDSSLKLHLLDRDRGFGIVNRWKDFSKDRAVVDMQPAAMSTILRLL
jgi:predicted AAA+ superfamily ATPase